MYAPKILESSTKLVMAPSPDVVPVRLTPPTPLPLLSLTVAVMMELARLETVSGIALREIAVGAPALIVMVALPEAFAPVAVAVSVTPTRGTAGGVDRAVRAIAVVCGYCIHGSDLRR